MIAYYVLDWERTSLKPYVEMLEKHALSLMSVVRRDRIANGQYVESIGIGQILKFLLDMTW